MRLSFRVLLSGRDLPIMLAVLRYKPGPGVRNDRRENPGLVRASFGLYNTLMEVDQLVTALARIWRVAYRGRNRQEPASGEFMPVQ
jgi:hypothetical protein